MTILDDGTFEKLKKEIGDKLKEGKEILQQIHDIYNEYKNEKTKALKEKLVQKIDELKPKLQAIEKRIDDELKNDHPGAIKKWLLEHGRDALKKLEKQVDDIETKLKGETEFGEFKYFMFNKIMFEINELKSLKGQQPNGS